MCSLEENSENNMLMKRLHDEKIQDNVFSLFEILPTVYRIRSHEDELLKAIDTVLELFEEKLQVSNPILFQQRYLGIIDSWLEYFSPSKLTKY